MPGGNAGKRANQPGLTPMSWKASRDPKWFIVRDTYFVAADGPESVSFQYLNHISNRLRRILS